MTKPNVLLLHGVLMNAMEMIYLKRLLEEQGFNAHSLSYPSVTHSIAENTDNLYRTISSLNCSELHIVAHSLGGIMTLHLLEKYPDLPMGRVVMLGTPINGSYAANSISRWKIAGHLLANSMADGLAGNHEFKHSSPREIGMIAGSIKSPLGLGLLLGKLPEENDGTVLLSETKHPVISQHLVVNKSHTGLVFSRSISKFVASYLRNGYFHSTSEVMGNTSTALAAKFRETKWSCDRK